MNKDDLPGDRGRARHFHGRTEILENFSAELRLAANPDVWESGTTFLIQGAPGAGKTALLDQFGDLAAAGGDAVGGQEWTVLEIDESALYDPAALMRRAGISYTSGEITAQSKRLEGGISKVIRGGGERKVTHHADADILQTLEELANRNPLLLVLDEAQTMEYKLDSHAERLLMLTLKHVHNGKLAKSVVLACGGLGNSSQVFAGLGISRFKHNCLVNLGRLSEADERAVIRDWLVKDGGAQEADIQPWVNAIAQDTYGWPQHITIYAKVAATRLKARNGQMTPEDLDWVLQEGRAGKNDYYWDRSGFLSSREVRVFAHTVQDTSRSGSIDREDFLERLMDRGPMSEEKAFRLFQELLHKGVLSPVRRSFGAYEIPIPSMKDFLLKEAGLEA